MPRDPHHAAWYGYHHQAKRKRERAGAYGKPCVRCGLVMVPGSKIQLDHLDGGGPNDYLGWAHRKCNLTAGAKKGRAIQLGRWPTTTTARTPVSRNSRDW